MDSNFEVVVIGGGQAGLATGYFLAQHGLHFVILDAHDRIGESWRRRWDTLRVFTAARFDSLPGMRFPAPAHYFPTKDEVAAYLEDYARLMNLPVQLRVRVDCLRRSATGEPGFVAEAGTRLFKAAQVVVATGAWQEPRIPPFAVQLTSEILQLHSSEFRSAEQLQPGAVLVVGAANSGAEIAHSVADKHETWLVGRDTGEMPFNINGRVARMVDPAFWFMINRILNTGNPIGRRARPSFRDRGTPLERVRKGELAQAGVKRLISRAVGVRDGLPELEDGQVLNVSNIVWATGFLHEYPWIQLGQDVIDEKGWPIHERGVSSAVPGLYFMGLPFQYSAASPLIGGVGPDAKYVVERIAAARKHE
jgi:putative flavoprotein involved in K+ transport